MKKSKEKIWTLWGHKLWESLETGNKEQGSSVSIDDLIKFVTQGTILVGQTNIALHSPVIPQTSQCFGCCYQKYHTSKIHVEKQV